MAPMSAPSDDTLVKVDTQMQIYHRNLQNSSMDILCAGFSGNCGGFFQQYLKGGADAVRDKTYLTPKNRFSLHRPVRPQRRGGNRRGDAGILISSFLIPIFLPLPSPGADFSRERALLMAERRRAFPISPGSPQTAPDNRRNLRCASGLLSDVPSIGSRRPPGYAPQC